MTSCTEGGWGLSALTHRGASKSAALRCSSFRLLLSCAVPAARASVLVRFGVRWRCCSCVHILSGHRTLALLQGGSICNIDPDGLKWTTYGPCSPKTELLGVDHCQISLLSGYLACGLDSTVTHCSIERVPLLQRCGYPQPGTSQ